MTTRTALIFVACGALMGAPATGATPVTAQSLASRVSSAPRDATISFAYTTRAGTCGDGDRIVSRRGEGDDISIMQMESNGSSSTFNSSSKKNRDEWLRTCEPGPARVRLVRNGTTVSQLRVSVGGSAGSEQDLGTVTPQQAVQFLLDLAEVAPKEIGSKAIFAASLADADEVMSTGLIAITRKPAVDRTVRKDAVYWLSQVQDSRAGTRLREILNDEREDIEVRKSSVFSIAQRNEPDAIQMLFNTARNSRQAELKKDAIFWLGNKAGEKATAGLTSMIDDDSQEMEVREAAVFAISQQQNEQSVTTLLNVAKTSKEPKIRRSALFWLGQRAGSDPRVLKLFEDILTGN